MNDNLIEAGKLLLNKLIDKKGFMKNAELSTYLTQNRVSGVEFEVIKSMFLYDKPEILRYIGNNEARGVLILTKSGYEAHKIGLENFLKQEEKDKITQRLLAEKRLEDMKVTRMLSIAALIISIIFPFIVVFFQETLNDDIFGLLRAVLWKSISH